MKTVYIDFDETIVQSNKRIIDILNGRYGVNKSEKDLKDYGYKSIAPISANEKFELFASDEFFDGLTFKDGFLDFYGKYKSIVNITIVTIGTKENLEKKEKWIRDNLDPEINCILIEGTSMNKKMVNMHKGIQIDDCTTCLDTNAEIKILYKSEFDYPWQRGYENSDVLIASTWGQIDEILGFYLKYDYKTLVKKREV